MSTPLDAFLHEAAGPKPLVHLAAFGKHPGWDDHLDDVGLETETLVVAKQLIYLRGLASQIDSAAWEDLAPAKRLAEFNHRFFWVGRNGFIAGELWSSQDGKGRSKYPMVLCAQANGVATGRALEIFPVLDQVKAACRATASADEVRRILASGRERLRADLEAPPPAGDPPAALPPAPRQALHRILYEIHAQMGDLAPGAAKGGPPMGLASRRLRAPASPADGAALAAWVGLVRSQLDPEVPVLGIAATDAGWIDLIAGCPSGQDFFCLRASAVQIPLTSEIPYTLETGFITAADALLDAPMGMAVAPQTIFGERPRGGLTFFPWGSSPVAPAGDPSADGPPPPSLKWLRTAFVLLVVAIIGATLYIALHHG